MTRERFFKLANQVFVPIPDPDAELRARIHAHFDKVQTDTYRAYEAERDAIWLRGEVPRLKLPSLRDIEEKAWRTFAETA
jgi:hypothetical protein